MTESTSDAKIRTPGRASKDANHDLMTKLMPIYKELPVGLCYVGTDLRFVAINDWLADINGKSAEEHLGRTLHELIPDVAKGVEHHFRQVIETGEPIIGAIREMIESIAESSTAVASAVEEQQASTQEISRNVQEAASGTKEVSQNIAGVNQAASESGAASNQVLESSAELLKQASMPKPEIARFLEDLNIT